MKFYVRGNRGAQRSLGSGRRHVGLLLATVLCASATMAVTATSAHAGTQYGGEVMNREAAGYGGVDMNRACQVQYGNTWGTELAEPRNAFSWHCVPTDPDQAVDVWWRGIDVSRACAEQYGDGAIYARYDETNFSDPYTWYCVRD